MGSGIMTETFFKTERSKENSNSFCMFCFFKHCVSLQHFVFQNASILVFVVVSVFFFFFFSIEQSLMGIEYVPLQALLSFKLCSVSGFPLVLLSPPAELCNLFRCGAGVFWAAYVLCYQLQGIWYSSSSHVSSL